MKAVKFFRKFFAVILVILFGFVLSILMTVLLTRDLLSEQSVNSYIEATEILDSKSEEVFNEEEGTNKTLRTEIQEELLQIGISKDITNEALNSEEMDQVLSSYISDYLDYVLFNEQRPMFPTEKVTAIIYEEIVDNNIELTNNQSKVLNTYLLSLANKVNSTIPSIYQLNNMGYDVYGIRLLSVIIFSSEALLGLLLILALITILIGVCLWSKLKALKNISIPIIIVGALLLIGGFMEVKFLNMMLTSEGFLDGLILNVVSKSFEKLLIYGSALLAIGIILLLVCGILIKKSKQKSSQLLENTINNSISEQVPNNIDNVVNEENTKENSTSAIIPESLPNIAINLSEEQIIKPEETIKANTEIPNIKIDNQEETQELKEVSPVELTEKPKEENIDSNKEDIEGNKLNNDTPEMEIIESPVTEKPKPKPDLNPISNNDEIEMIEMEQIEDSKENNSKDKIEYNPDKYIEMDEEVEDIVKKDIKITPPKPVNINVISPKKGKDIKVDLTDEEEEEEIELL